MALQLRSGCRKTLQIQNPSLCHLVFSSSYSNGGEDDKPPSASSCLSSIEASLPQSPPPQSRSRSPSPPLPPPKASKIASLKKIPKNLSEFRRRSAAPPPSDGRDSSSPPTISFQDPYKSNVISKGTDANADSAKLSFESICENLRQHRSSNPTAGTDRSRGMQGEIRSPLSLKPLKESLKLKPPEDSGIFGREMGEVKTEAELQAESQAALMEFVKTYNFGDLDEYKWQREIEEEREREEERGFELMERDKMIGGLSVKDPKDSLVKVKNSSDASTKRSSSNERLKQQREIEEEETETTTGGLSFKSLKDTLLRLKNSSDASTKRSSSNERLKQQREIEEEETETTTGGNSSDASTKSSSRPKH